MDDAEALPDVYDQVHYPGLSHARSHPGHMGAIAQLLGLDPAPPGACRVLEIGCASGYNLIPMAEALPGSRFLGVDTSRSQVEEGRAIIAALGLSNIELECRDLSSINEGDGKFDYIIAYGVYSWVPEATRDRLLALIRSNLADFGIAYVSYDTYPGWFQMRKMREMMLYHVRRIEEPSERVAAARELVAFLAAADDEQHGAHGPFMQAYARNMATREDGFLLHDELAPINDPVYFHEFAAHLEEHGLAYLAEADFPEVMAARLPAGTAAGVQQMARTLVDREQYMDFIRDRGFRESLISHVATVGLRDLTVQPERYRRFFVSSHTTATGAVDPTSSDVARFEISKELYLATNHPVSKAAMVVLDEEFPLPVAFDELFTRAATLVYGEAGPSAAEEARDREALAELLLRGFAQDIKLISLSIAEPGFIAAVTTRPAASALARFRAANGQRTVVSLAHQQIGLEPLSARLLPLLDGTRSREQLLEEFVRWHATEAAAHNAPAASREDLEADFFGCLAALAGHALLKG